MFESIISFLVPFFKEVAKEIIQELLVYFTKKAMTILEELLAKFYDEATKDWDDFEDSEVYE